MQFDFLNDLCESHLIPSKTSLKSWRTKKLAEMAYLYFLGLHILLTSEHEQKWAQHYCKKAGEPNDFLTWRTAQNDLYIMLYALDSDSEIEPADSKERGKVHLRPAIIRKWLRHVAVHEDDASLREETHRLFAQLDSMFHITDSSFKSLRRIIMDWHEATKRERHDTLTKLIQKLNDRVPSNSELLPHLRTLAKAEKVAEAASSGGTGAANVAAVVGGLGAGFNPDDDWRSIYKKTKPIILRRSLEDGEED
jgi:hypothetical protein